MNRRKKTSRATERRSRAQQETRKRQSRAAAEASEAKAQRAELVEAKRVLRSRGWLSDQSRRFQLAMLERATLQQISVGSAVFNFGDFGGGIYGLAKGAIGVYVPQRNGHHSLASIRRAGTWFGYGPTLTRRRRTLSFAAIEPTVVLHVPLGVIDQLVTSDPSYLRTLMRVSEYGMDHAIEVVADTLIPNAEKRIAATLLRIAPDEATEPSGPLIISGLTQAQIGQLANAARDVVNRTLKRFEAKGWIEVSYRRVSLLEPKAMEKYCS